MSKKDNLHDFLEDLHEGILTKKPGASRNPQNFRSEIESITGGGDSLAEYDGICKVTGVPTEEDHAETLYEYDGKCRVSGEPAEEITIPEEPPIFDGTIEIDGVPATDYTDYYEKGKTEGIAEGFADGKEAGIAEGYQTGYTDGESAGFGDGKEFGYTIGYDQGKKAEYDAFWDVFQQNGDRTDYSNAFNGQSFDFANFFPKYDIRPTGYAESIFYAWERASHSGSLVQRLKECGVVLDTSNCTNLGSAFAYTQITEIPTIDCTGLTANTQQVFAHCYSRLKKIENLIVKEGIEFTNWFINTDIEEVIFEGVISTGSLNLQWAKRLNKASWVSIMTAASTTASITITGSLVSVNKAFETSEGANDGSTSPEWLALKAARPNVSVSLI